MKGVVRFVSDEGTGYAKTGNSTTRTHMPSDHIGLFRPYIWLGDIVAVNGAPAMGACSCTARGSAAVARLPPGIRSTKGPEQE